MKKLNFLTHKKPAMEPITGNVYLVLDLETAGLAAPVFMDGKWVNGADVYSMMQIAGILLDSDLNEIARFDIPLKQEGLVNGETIKFHRKTGFMDAWSSSEKFFAHDAETVIINLLEETLGYKNLQPYTYDSPVKILLLGKSIWFDRAFLTRRMPFLTSKLSHQMVDTSCFKPKLYEMGIKKLSKTLSTHFAMDDCEAAIADYKVLSKLINNGIDPHGASDCLEDRIK